MMNFVDVRKDDCYYVDKTRFIPVIEQANKFFFYIRPRRFGKSLIIICWKHTMRWTCVLTVWKRAI